ncbi:glucosaminidase domain-containing protein, partial [Streptococcus agalactiae]
YNILPSGIICQLYLESLWGDSAVGKRDNNWAGISGGAQTRPSGVKVTTGMARPPSEGGTYMHYASVDDFLKDYTYLLAKQGLYNVVGKKNIADYTKGLFRVGGAKDDYAAAGYQSYTNLMTNIRNGINKVTGNILNTIDKLWQTPVQPITAVNVARRA